MAFDPDAYLAAKESAPFDPDAYLASKGAPPEPGLGARIKDFALGLLPPTSGPVGALVNAATGGAYGKVAHEHGGIYQGTPTAPERLLGESDREYATRAAHEALTDPAQQSRAFAAAGLFAGNRNKVIGEQPPTLIPQPVRDWAQGQAINSGRRTLTGGANLLAVKKPISPEAVQAALGEGAIKPFRGIQATAEALEGVRERVGDDYGRIVSDLEAAGVKGPNALALAKELRLKADTIEANSAGTGAPELYRKIADELESKPAAHSPQGPGTPELNLSQAENIKRSLQQKAKYDRVQGDTVIEGARKDMASTLRQANEDAIAQQSSLAPGPAAEFVPVKERLGSIIEASEAANKGAAQAARRSQFGLTAKLNAGTAASGTLAATGSPVAAAQAGAAVGGVTQALVTRGAPTMSWLMDRVAKVGGRPFPSGASTTGPMAGTAGGAFEFQPAMATARTRTETGEQRSAAQPPGRIGTIGRVMDALDADPSALGVYGPALQFARQKGGDDAVAARHFVLWQTDPQYRETVGGAE